jgi:hypothetical protein
VLSVLGLDRLFEIVAGPEEVLDLTPARRRRDFQPARGRW